MPSRLLAVLAALAVVGGACSGGAPTIDSELQGLEPLAALRTGEPLPDATLPVLGGRGELAIAELRGTPAVINFWATWCAFCVDEMPDFEAVHQEVQGRVRFVGVDREDQPDRALQLAERTGVTYELVEDPDGDFFRAVKGRGMPTTLLVDPDGVVRYRHAGPLTREQLRALIADHLDV